MSLEIDGIAELGRRMQEIAQRFPEERDKFLKQEAELIIGRAKYNTPLDTGTLRGSWKRTAPTAGQIEVYNNTEYAAHVEYGHRLWDRKKKDWKKDASGKMKFVPGANMLQEAMDETKKQLRNDAKRILGRLFQ